MTKIANERFACDVMQNKHIEEARLNTVSAADTKHFIHGPIADVWLPVNGLLRTGVSARRFAALVAIAYGVIALKGVEQHLNAG